MKEIGENRGRRAGADQPFGLERLDRRRAEMFPFGVEQPPIGAADAIGAQRLLQVVGLEQDAKPGDGAFLDRRGGERSQRRPKRAQAMLRVITELRLGAAYLPDIQSRHP